jgi:hypothetical protein
VVGNLPAIFPEKDRPFFQNPRVTMSFARKREPSCLKAGLHSLGKSQGLPGAPFLRPHPSREGAIRFAQEKPLILSAK